MGYATLMSPCLFCKQPFMCNPMKVPSFRVKGVKEPVCESCMKRVNAKRIEQGMEPYVIPADAYEACPEEELIYGDE